MKKKSLFIVLLICVSLFLLFFAGKRREGNKHQGIITIEENGSANFNIEEGYVCQRKENIKVVYKGQEKAIIKLSEPQLVAQSDIVEKWGYFQFPIIGRTDDGKLVVSWQMREDTHKSYGKGGTGQMMSRNEGKTWESLDSNYQVKWSRALETRSGKLFQVYTPTSKDIHAFQTFPKPVCSDKSLKMDFYSEVDLPNELRGAYFDIQNVTTHKTRRIHGELKDSGLIRYAMDDLMPIMWWGDIKELKDGALVAGVYRCYYQESSNTIPKSGITFYKSNDGGYHWKAIGKIPYRIKELTDRNRQYDKTRGFSEACFEILKDSTFFCVIRSGYNTPLYKTYSFDKGEHWSDPEAFTPNGVRPMLLQLENGVMVMTSGRPGLQLRINIEGDGKLWTAPIEMLPLKDEKGYFDMWSASCGYSCLLPLNDHSFYLVYSDFKKKNKKGEERKAIIFRKIEIIKKYKP